MLLFIKTLFLYYFLYHTCMSKPWIFWLYFSLHLLYTSVTTILMNVLQRIQGMSWAIWICTISHNHPICKKVTFPWKRSCWYHSIIWRLINRIWVYPKCNFNFPNTDAILLKHVFVHVCSVHVIKCKVVFYILLLLYCEKICHANAFRN